MQTHGLNNIIYEKPIDLSSGDFTDEDGFFLRSAEDTTVTYCPLNNKTDAEAITKTISASPYFIDPVIMRKVFAIGSPVSEDLYAGYGV